MSAVATAPMPSSSTRPMTADDFYEFVNLPENETKDWELVRGRVVEMSRPTRTHGLVQSNVAFEIKRYARTAKVGYVIVESGVILEQNPDTVRGPDVSFFAESTRFEDLPPRWRTLPPALAVEILSPNDRPGMVNAKVRDYLDNGVQMVWVVDYEDRTVTVHRQNKPFAILTESESLTGGTELPGFECPIRNLFLADGEQS